jgi:hypothetical protein
MPHLERRKPLATATNNCFSKKNNEKHVYLRMWVVYFSGSAKGGPFHRRVNMLIVRFLKKELWSRAFFVEHMVCLPWLAHAA